MQEQAKHKNVGRNSYLMTSIESLGDQQCNQSSKSTSLQAKRDENQLSPSSLSLIRLYSQHKADEMLFECKTKAQMS